MARRCTFEACVDPEEVGCNRGRLLEECEHWIASANPPQSRDAGTSTGASAAAPHNATARSLRLPWTGNSFGLHDAEFITACARTTLVGLVGPFNAGKTTLLSLMYLLLQNGNSIKLGSFSGSASLVGWENLANTLRWKPGEGGPTFPPHTTRSAGRCPGLLHVAFRDGVGARRDFLLTDPQGEWFNAWAPRAQAPGAEGARWIQQYADKFLFLVDREALAAPERGKTRDNLRDLARRLSTGLRRRPVAVVWTKSDVDVSPTIESDLRRCFSEEFPAHTEFPIRMRFGNESSTKVEAPCLELMNWLFSLPTPSRALLEFPPRQTRDPFLCYRGSR